MKPEQFRLELVNGLYRAGGTASFGLGRKESDPSALDEITKILDDKGIEYRLGDEEKGSGYPSTPQRQVRVVGQENLSKLESLVDDLKQTVRGR